MHGTYRVKGWRGMVSSCSWSIVQGCGFVVGDRPGGVDWRH